MTLSDPTDTQPAVKQARKRGRSAEEKRRQSAERKQRHRSTTAGTAQADTVRENQRLRMQCSRASKENTPPPSQQESTLSGNTMTAVPNPQRRPMRFRVSTMHHQSLQCAHQPRVDRMRQCQQHLQILAHAKVQLWVFRPRRIGSGARTSV
jgi:hypothetical protein